MTETGLLQHARERYQRICARFVDTPERLDFAGVANVTRRGREIEVLVDAGALRAARGIGVHRDLGVLHHDRSRGTVSPGAYAGADLQHEHHGLQSLCINNSAHTAKHGIDTR